MKKNISTLLSASFLIFSILVTACSASTPAFVQTPIVENTALPTETVEFTPIPTFTEEVQAAVQPVTEIPTLTPPAVPSGPLNVIQFKANGTYTDITDSITTGSSKTYSVNAMKGQIMSISVLPQIPDGGWGYMPMQIQGADGSVLCPQAPDTACMFWRGALPSSQDYFVTLTPDGDIPKFTMRVAINPPGKDAQYFQYDNPATGLTLTYPDIFAPSIAVYGNYKITPELTLHLIDSKFYEKTNLSEAYLFISSSSDAQIVATCIESNQNGGSPEQSFGIENVNRFTFIYSTSDGAGAGNYYEQQIYRMVNQNVCYEVIYFIHSTNVGNYPAGTVTEFDRDALMQKFYSVFSTFTIK